MVEGLGMHAMLSGFIFVLLFSVVGLMDTIKGYAPLHLAVATAVAGTLAYLTLPMLGGLTLLSFLSGIVLTAIFFVILRRKGSMGYLDLLVPYALPYTMLLVMLSANPLTTVVTAGLGGALFTIQHALRASRCACDGIPLPVGEVSVRGSCAKDRWYYIPKGVNIEDDDAIANAKSAWDKRGCVQALLGFPLVGFYSVLLLLVFLSLTIPSLLS